MGSKASKPAQSAARKFPSRAPGAVPPTSRPSAPPPQARPTPAASFAKNDAIRADGGDPDSQPNNPNSAFSQRLRQMGIATPNPTLSNSSTASPVPAAGSQYQQPQGRAHARYPSPGQNQTLNALEARQRLQEQVDLQLENPREGREYADVGTLRQALMMRQRGVGPDEVERRLRLRGGVLERIESRGVVAPLTAGS